MSNQMIIRIDSDLKEKVSKVAKAEGKTTSEVVRTLIEEYVRDRDIGAYIDGLWDRIGNNLKAKGLTQKDVAKAIREVRKKS
ncbi:MAG TPA: ribbon-helix-helix protein, CopG family [Deltaproteobacteria bacterium]|nr:ribbon-helix-helix protein, CopG family [Deltaproteobacteria bacterium]